MSQEFDNNVLDPVKQKRFYPYEYMGDFKESPGKKKFYSSSTDKEQYSQRTRLSSRSFGINRKWK